MPELPEVTTTADILNKLIRGKKILSVWTNYASTYYFGKENIKDPNYFKKFKREIINHKVVAVWRRAKNVLIDISGEKTILIHMKMTGHLLYGKYIFNKKKNEWAPKDKNSPLADPFNKFIRLVFEFSDGTHLAFSDMRKFATVSLIPDKVALGKKFQKIGPEPLEKSFTWQKLKGMISKKPNGKIKTVLMNPEIIAGIGNIYSDEILWMSKIKPNRPVKTLKDADIKEILKNAKIILKKGIDFGGDSMSDYRNPYGLRGDFQNHHKVYKRKNSKCLRKNCEGIIKREVVNGRSAHYCEECQK